MLSVQSPLDIVVLEKNLFDKFQIMMRQANGRAVPMWHSQVDLPTLVMLVMSLVTLSLLIGWLHCGP